MPLRTGAPNCKIQTKPLNKRKRPGHQFSLHHRPSGLQELPEVFVHASRSQLLQAVVAVDDVVGGHHHHPDAVRVVAQLASDGRAHHHVQAAVASAGVSVVMAGENRLHPCAGERGVTT